MNYNEAVNALNLTTLCERRANLCQVYIDRLRNENHPLHLVLPEWQEFVHNYALISGHPEGLTPGTYGGIARDLLTFVANFWPGTGPLDHFCTFEARYTGKTRGICNIATILKMKDPDRVDWVYGPVK